MSALKFRFPSSVILRLKVLNESKCQTSREGGNAQREAARREEGMIKYVRMDGWLRFHPALHARCAGACLVWSRFNEKAPFGSVWKLETSLKFLEILR